jgi:hypothetical protein
VDILKASVNNYLVPFAKASLPLFADFFSNQGRVVKTTTTKSLSKIPIATAAL